MVGYHNYSIIKKIRIYYSKGTSPYYLRITNLTKLNIVNTYIAEGNTYGRKII